MNNFLLGKKDIQVLVFQLNGVFYGIPIELSIKEVAMFEEKNFKRTIETEQNVVGSIILRDKMIPMIDLKERYTLSKNTNEQKSIVVLKKYNSNKEELVSLLIEDKLDIKTINVEKIEKKDSNIKEIFGYTKFYIDNNKFEFLILLDTNKFFK